MIQMYSMTVHIYLYQLKNQHMFTSHICQPIQFTGIKYIVFHYFGGIWPYWKMDRGKHNFHEILLLFKTSKKIEKLLNDQSTHVIAKCTLTGQVQ